MSDYKSKSVFTQLGARNYATTERQSEDFYALTLRFLSFSLTSSTKTVSAYQSAFGNLLVEMVI